MNDQYLWNFFFSVLYAALLAAAVWYLGEYQLLPTSISFFDALLLVLATFRAAHLIVYDKILQFARSPFFVVVHTNTESGEPSVHLAKREKGIRRTIADLLSCPWCTGVWVALPIAFFYFVTPFAWFPIFVLAVSGTATFIQLISNQVGWSAERLKQKTLRDVDNTTPLE